MVNIWVVLSEERVEILKRSATPVLQTRGKGASLFPLYIQCRSDKDAKDVCEIHEQLSRLYASYSDSIELAGAIHRFLNCSTIMSSVDSWFVLLNGRNFRGIIQVESDLDAQTRDFRYSSWRKAESFEDALLIMVLKGEKSLLAEIKAVSPSTLSVTTSIDQLSLSSSLMDDKGEMKAPPSLSACGRSSMRLPSTSQTSARFSNTPDKPTPSQGLHAAAERKFSLQPRPAPTHYSRWPRSPVYLPENGFSTRPVYKYIRNVTGTVGAITDRSGVLSNITDEDFEILGNIRARYLESHGYASAELAKIVSAFDIAASIEDFISRAEGCGMSIVELEWFWDIE